MDTIGERIRAERERLGLTQEAFAAIADSAKRSQVGWEQNRTRPDADALAQWAKHGADVLYIITGQRSAVIDMTLLGMSEAAIKQAYAEQRPSEAIPSTVTINALTKVYNSVAAKLTSGTNVAHAVREAAAHYIAFLDDPADPALLTRALFRAPKAADPEEAKPTTLSIGGNARVAGRDFHQGGEVKRRR